MHFISFSPNTDVHLLEFVPLTYATLPVRCSLVAGVTGALVGSWHVDTLAILTQVVTQLALIDI